MRKHAAHTTKNAKPHKWSQNAQGKPHFSYEIQIPHRKIARVKYNMQWPRNIWHCCTTPATICSRDIIQQATFLWGTWELLSFLAPTEFVLCCTRKQHEAEHSDVDQSISYIFPFKFFHQAHIFVPGIYHIAPPHHTAIICVSVIFGTTLLHAKFLYST